MIKNESPKTILVVWIWKKIPEVFAKRIIEDLDGWMNKGAETDAADEEDRDHTFLFCNGKEAIGSYEEGSDNGHKFVANTDGTMSLVMWVRYAFFLEDGCDPQISVLEENGWDMPDEMLIMWNETDDPIAAGETWLEQNREEA